MPLYLAPYIGLGTARDPCRPRGSDQPGWSSIDLRATGGGNVIAYNYMEDGYIGSDTTWVETGLMPGHMTTPHYELFEGNQSFNFDPDNTWGNAIYILAHRNHLTSKRRSLQGLGLSDSGNPRGIGLMEGHWWYTFVGNVIGTSGMNPSPMSGYEYEDIHPFGDGGSLVPMWRLGYNPEAWSNPADPKVLSTVLRGGTYDFFTNSVHWENITQQAIPNSYYLSAKPAFFGTCTWPWTDSLGSTKLYTLPARARFDTGSSPC